MRSAPLDELNALTIVFPASAERHEALPLSGVRVAVKDNVDVLGAPTTNGLPGAWPVAAYDAPVVARLRRAGAAVVAKTNMSELALGATTRNRTFGDGRNPWSPDRVPGGSSGGAAAAVAAGLCDLAVGSDTGGSIRNPASVCGVVGLRPTLGRISTEGLTPLCRRHDTIGLLARDAALVERAFSTIASTAAAEVDRSQLRIGIPDRHFLDDLDRGIGTRIDQTIAGLNHAGARLRNVRLRGADRTQAALGVLIAREAARLHGSLMSRDELLEPYVHDRLRAGLSASEATVVAAERTRERWRADVLETFDRVDLIATPTVPVATPPVGVDPESATQALNRLTAAWSLATTPALSLPCGLDDAGMPVGLQLVAAPGRDEVLLAAARTLQRDGVETIATARLGGDHGHRVGP